MRIFQSGSIPTPVGKITYYIQKQDTNNFKVSLKNGSEETNTTLSTSESAIKWLERQVSCIVRKFEE